MVDIDEVWRRRTDEQLLDAARVLDEYTEEGRRAILLLLALGVIDWIFIFGDRRQRLGDKLARTKVIYAGTSR